MKLTGLFGAVLLAMIAVDAHAQHAESGAAAPSNVVVINPAPKDVSPSPEPAPSDTSQPARDPDASGAAPAASTAPAAAQGDVEGEGTPSPEPAKPADGADKAAMPLPETTLTINIDLGAQRMTVYEDGESRFHWAISSARYGYHTPTGTFKPTWMTRMWYSRQYDYSPMPHSIFFHKGVAIHGSHAIRQLGQPASHGCVRVSPGNAAKLYSLVNKHGMEQTKIVVHGTPNYRGPLVAEYDEPRYMQRRYARGYGYGGYYYYEPPPYYYPPRRQRGLAGDRSRRYVQRGLYRNYGYSWGF